MMKKDKKEKNNELIDASSVGLQQKTGIPKIIFGMLCRFVVAYLGVTGICLMLDDAFKFFNGQSDPGRVFLTSFLFCALIFLLYVAANTNAVFFGIALAAAFVALAAIDAQNGLKQSIVYIPRSVWNHILLRLDALGYTSLSGFIDIDPYSNPATMPGMSYVVKAFNSFCALASFIFVSCTFKRVRTVPVIITAGTVMTLTFTYNLITNNLGFLLMVASGFGVIVMKYCDVFAKTEREADKKAKLKFFERKRLQLAGSATRGFAALTATAVVLAVAAVPAAKINKPFPEITVFNDFMDSAREVVSQFLTGRGGMIGDDPFAAQKNTYPSPRSFSNRRMFTVTASTYVPLYLRSWVGEEYKNNQWVQAEGAADIIPEEVTDLFYTIVDVDCLILPNQLIEDPATLKRGFAKEFISIKSSEKRSTAYLASRYSTLYGITSGTDMNEKYAGGYKFKLGVGTAELSDKGRSYGYVSYAQNYKKVSLSRLDKDMVIYDIVYPYIVDYISSRLYGGGSGLSLSEIKNEILRKAEEKGVGIPAGCLINRIGDMTNDELFALSEKMSNAALYENYVYTTCTYVPWSEKATVERIAKDALGTSGQIGYYDGSYLSGSVVYPSSILIVPVNTDGAGTRMSDIYTLADKTARYLSEQCEYTLKPQGYNVNGSYIVQFLTSAKNGYCVQFATAGALMLRSVGIPTRYVDGYLASDMKYSGGRYSCTVLDNNAHAWIEVYVKGYGWLTFEMTAPMISGMYSSETPTVVPDETEIVPVYETTDIPGDTTDVHEVTTDNNGPQQTTEPETTDVSGPGTGDGAAGKIILTAAIVLASVLLVSTAVYLYLKKTTKRRDRLMKTLEDAAEGNSKDPENDIKAAGDYITLLLSKYGVERRPNELMSEFAERVDGITKGMSFGPAADALQKNAFGHCADAEDVKAAAEYALFLRIHVIARLNSVNRFIYVTVRKIL